MTEITYLSRGSHPPAAQELCLLEAVAFIAEEPWSDAPECVCPVLATYGRALNDALPDDDRQKLLEFVPLLIGTRSTPEIEQKRAFHFADAAVRRFVPPALKAAGLIEHAERLEALPPIVDTASARAARDVARAIRAAAGTTDAETAATWASAATTGVTDAAWAVDAATDAAWAVTWAATWATKAATWATWAAVDAATDAAWAVAAPEVREYAIEVFREAIAIQ